MISVDHYIVSWILSLYTYTLYIVRWLDRSVTVRYGYTDYPRRSECPNILHIPDSEMHLYSITTAEESV